MTREEAKRRLLDIERCTPIHTREDVRDFEALEMAIKALEQELCGDVISRQAVRHILNHEVKMPIKVWKKLFKLVDDLPPVNPQEPKIGYWIQTNEFFINQDGQFIYNFICSECKSLSYFRKSNKKAIGANVCPNCGAKMESEG